MRYSELSKLNEDRIPDSTDIPSGFYDPAKDKVNSKHLDDVTSPKLTLKRVNKLKKIRATKELELAKNRELLDIMYGEPEQE